MFSRCKDRGNINGVFQIKGNKHILFLELKDIIKIEIK